MNAAKSKTDGKDFITYAKRCAEAGVDFHNIINLTSHWLHGTDPVTLAKLTAQGLVYNPPGH